MNLNAHLWMLWRIGDKLERGEEPTEAEVVYVRWLWSKIAPIVRGLVREIERASGMTIHQVAARLEAEGTARRLEEIGRLEDVLREERIRAEEATPETLRSEPAPIFDPGIPTDASAWAMATDDQEEEQAEAEPEPDPEERSEEEYWQEMKERDEETPPEASEPEGEPEKPCKACGDPKPLSEFPRNGTYKDGHTNKCKSCTREYQQRKTAESKERAAEGQPRAEVRELRPKEERRCANGTSCAAVDPDDLIPTPAILDEANPGPRSRRCQRRAGVA